MSSDGPRWPEQEPGPEAMWHRQKGEKGDKGDPGEAMTPGARRAVIVLFLFSVALAVLNLLFTAHEVNRLAHVAGTVAGQHQVQVYACRLGNQKSAQELRVWQHIIAVSVPPPHETTAQRKAREAQIAAFLAYVRAVYAAQDCTAIYRLRR